MKNLVIVIGIALLGWIGYSEYQSYKLDTEMRDTAPSYSTMTSDFECDGRIHCSEMTSCEEATYFIQHCPNAKMDGDYDGVPCERQWCY